ncbi:MAG: FMN reductase [Pseudonocardiales bacterium]|nr:MAG: FMN reductase [Pseudonocardiales bacterium]
MKIAVVGATGMVGSRVVDEAASRGHDVTAVSRTAARAQAQPNVAARTADISDSTVATALAAEHDVVVSAIGPSRAPGGDPGAFAGTLTQLARDARAARLVVVGGAGSLLAAPGVRLIDTPEFPEIHKVEALAAADAFDALRRLDDIGEWTYVSPAPILAPGERTGSYVLGEDSPVGDTVSVEDFAVALLDEIEKPAHTGRRFTVAN